MSFRIQTFVPLQQIICGPAGKVVFVAYVSASFFLYKATMRFLQFVLLRLLRYAKNRQAVVVSTKIGEK